MMYDFLPLLIPCAAALGFAAGFHWGRYVAGQAFVRELEDLRLAKEYEDAERRWAARRAEGGTANKGTNDAIP